MRIVWNGLDMWTLYSDVGRGMAGLSRQGMAGSKDVGLESGR